jgi:hypothetical protein
MATRIAILCTLAAALAAGCNRSGPPSCATDAVSVAVVPPKGDNLARPVPIEVDGKPLVRDGGAGYPFVGDFDRDGLPDLLLGSTRDGRLLVYRNAGTATSPRLTAPQWFDDAVPSARIPAG